jgi:hypothetical protein
MPAWRVPSVLPEVARRGSLRRGDLTSALHQMRQRGLRLGRDRNDDERAAPGATLQAAGSRGMKMHGKESPSWPRTYRDRDRGFLGRTQCGQAVDDGLRARAFRWPPLRLAPIVPRARIRLCRFARCFSRSLNARRLAVKEIGRACSLRRGLDLQADVPVAPVVAQGISSSQHPYVERVLPVRKLIPPGSDAHRVVQLTLTTTVPAARLETTLRCTSLNRAGIVALQQRVVGNQTRVKVPPSVIAVHCRGPLTELELWTDWR